MIVLVHLIAAIIPGDGLYFKNYKVWTKIIHHIFMNAPQSSPAVILTSINDKSVHSKSFSIFMAYQQQCWNCENRMSENFVDPYG